MKENAYHAAVKDFQSLLTVQQKFIKGLMDDSTY